LYLASYIPIIIILIIIVTAILAIIVNLKYCSYLLALQQVFVSLLNKHPHEVVTSVIFMGLVTPLILLFVIKRTKIFEVKPSLKLSLSIAIVIILCTVSYIIAKLIFQLIQIQLLTLFLIILGLYMVLLRRDVLKIIMGFISIETGAHVFLATSASQILTMPLFGFIIEIIVVFIIALFAYLTIGMYSEYKTTDVRVLRRLVG